MVLRTEVLASDRFLATSPLCLLVMGRDHHPDDALHAGRELSNERPPSNRPRLLVEVGPLSPRQSLVVGARVRVAREGSNSGTPSVQGSGVVEVDGALGRESPTQVPTRQLIVTGALDDKHQLLSDDGGGDLHDLPHRVSAPAQQSDPPMRRGAKEDQSEEEEADALGVRFDSHGSVRSACSSLDNILDAIRRERVRRSDRMAERGVRGKDQVEVGVEASDHAPSSIGSRSRVGVVSASDECDVGRMSAATTATFLLPCSVAGVAIGGTRPGGGRTHARPRPGAATESPRPGFSRAGNWSNEVGPQPQSCSSGDTVQPRHAWFGLRRERALLWLAGWAA